MYELVNNYTAPISHWSLESCEAFSSSSEHWFHEHRFFADPDGAGRDQIREAHELGTLFEDQENPEGNAATVFFQFL